MNHAQTLCLVAVAGPALLTGCVAPGLRSGSVALVVDGKPTAGIVLAATPSRAAQFAAAELQEHVRQITGATLPRIAEEDRAFAGTRILVGASRATEALGLRNADFAPQEYTVAFGQGRHRPGLDPDVCRLP